MKKIIALFSVLFCSGLLAADSSQTSIQYLSGKNYGVASEQQDATKANIITFEHVSSWKYGDNFLFLDLTHPFVSSHTNKQEMYGEWHPRFSATKIFGAQWDGVVKDISLAAELNFGRSSFGANRAVLYGIGLDFKVPFFAVLSMNIFARNNNDSGVSTFQFSPYWLLFFDLGSSKWEFNGFMDYETAKDSRKANYLFSPQILLDVGSFFQAAGRFHVGIEYNRWSNKFGIENNNEERVQLMGRWIL